MRGMGLIGLVIVLAVGYYIYSQQVQSTAGIAGTASPQAVIDVVGVKNDLVAFANAERQQFALEGTYLSLEELRAKGAALPPDARGHYVYSAEVSDSEFRVTATYDGPAGSSAPTTLSIGPTMQIR